MTRISTLATAAILAGVLATPAFAGGPQLLTVDFDHATGSTVFHAVGHPSALRITGKGSAPKGELSWKDGKVTGSLIVDLDSLDTGIGMRTRHMKEKYLEVGKFPQAKLTLTELSLPAEDMAKDFSSDKVPFAGTLLLHGVEKPVVGVAQVERKGETVHVDAQFAVKISDYGIAVPSFAGITVADNVSLEVEADTPLQAAPTAAIKK